MVTVVVMATFFGIVWWAYAPARKADWERKGELDD
jgi:cbb3-type cytochrome oxidase subunit 3